MNEFVKYGLRTIVVVLLGLLVILTIEFVALRIAAGDPAMLAMPRVPGEAFPEDVMEEIRAIFDEPIAHQYVHFIQDMLSGEFYYSYAVRADVSDFIYGFMWRTVALFGAALTVSILIGILYGYLASSRRSHVVRHIVSLVPLAMMAGSIVVVAWIAVRLTVVETEIFPSSGYPNSGYQEESLLRDLLGNTQLAHSILPVLIVSFVSVGAFALITRDGCLLGSSVNGRSAERSMFKSDGLFVSLPVLQLYVAALMCCVIVAEFVLSYRGLGYLLIDSLYRMDYFPIQASFFLIALIVFLANIMIYLLVTLIRPNRCLDLPRQDLPTTGTPVVSIGRARSSAQKSSLPRSLLAAMTSVCRNYVRSPVGMVALAVFVILFGIAVAGSQEELGFDGSRRPIPYDPSALFLIGAVAPMTLVLLGGLVGFALAMVIGTAFGRTFRYSHAIMQGIFHGTVSIPLVPFVILTAIVSVSVSRDELASLPRIALIISLPAAVLVGHSIVLSRQRLWSQGREPGSVSMRELLPKMTSWGLFGLKYGLVAGISAMLICDFIGVTNWESWGRSLEIAHDWGLILTSGGWDYVLPALVGISLLISSVFLILDTLENIIRRKYGAV